MRNKNVGYLVIGIAVVMAILVWIFNKGLKDIVSATCTHGPTCSMYESISIQTWISLAIVALVLVIGLFLVFSKEHERIIIKKQKEKKMPINLSGLENDEKKVIKFLQEENGAIFQRTLMEKLGIGKVGITRLLDKLEAKQIIERKRRGMNNIVVLRL
ncbi:MAG: hypothetical protein MUF61_01820 [archaeon]|jgi:uncharacterized membrane protein|nr:hypothetical protein [archaeon]